MIWTIEKFPLRQEVIDLITQLFIQTDRRDWAAVRRCFTDRVKFDMTSLSGGEPQELTPAQITDAWETGLKELQSLHHQVGNFVVDMQGDAAHVFCYGIAIHYQPNPSGRNTRTFVGTYHFDCDWEAGGWKIRSFKFDCKFIDGNPELK
jgi:hypothetical protein